jgi:hypothetical protein
LSFHNLLSRFQFFFSVFKQSIVSKLVLDALVMCIVFFGIKPLHHRPDLLRPHL